jgi:hypothetical protein
MMMYIGSIPSASVSEISRAFAEDECECPPSPTPKPTILPQDSSARKNLPITTGVLDYFPRALAYVAMVSKAGNPNHTPREPLHWAKDTSVDHPDCIARHLIERGTRDPVDGMRHSGMMAWRSLANLELELETAEKNGESW